MTAGQVDEIMVQQVDTVEADHPAREARRRMEASEIRSLVVVQGNRPVGIVKRNSLLNVHDTDLEKPVTDYMVTEYPVVRQGQSIDDVARFDTSDINIEQYPVVSSDGELVGAVLREQVAPSRQGAATGGTLSDSPVGDRAPVREGMNVKAANGSSLGTFKDATFQADGSVEFFVVEYGLIFKKQKQLPGDLIASIEGDDVHLKLDSTEFKMMRDIGEED